MLTVQKYMVLLVMVVKTGDNLYLDDGNDVTSDCKCVQPHLCEDYEDNHDLGIRFADDSCPNFYEVCCQSPKTETSKPPTYECGTQKFPNIGPRITSNSEITRFSELPWTVLVLQRDRNAFICGGSLIHPQVVITAGHCVFTGESAQIKIRAGEWNIKNTKEPLPHQDSNVKEILLHPQFKNATLWNDVALLFLKKPFKEAANVGFICLVPPTFKLEINSCIVSGWGKNAFLKSRHSAVLRKVDLPIVPRSRCQTSLRNTRLGKLFKLHKSFICAGGEKNKDACKGDGGSPLICPVPGQQDRYFQMGIVSWGIGCGLNKTPGVYVNLPLYTDWISESLRARNLSTSYYKL